MNGTDSANGAVNWHDTIAEAFDGKYSRSPRFIERLAVWRDLITNHVSPGDLVLDAGCGSGVFSFEAATRGASVLGIDGSAEMIAIARRRQSELGDANIDFRVGRIEQLRTWPAASYDVVMASSVIEYMPNLAGEIASFSRLLKPDGRLIVSVPNAASLYRIAERAVYRLVGRPRYYTHVRSIAKPNEFTTIMAGAGLEAIDLVFYADPPIPPAAARMMGSGVIRKTLFVAVGRKAG